MLREATAHADWCENTMSMLKEKQFEACEQRLYAHPSIGLFSKEVKEQDAQRLWECSFYQKEMPQALQKLEDMRACVLAQLPQEVCYLPQGEVALLERLIISGGTLALEEWDDIGAAEALVSRLWCSFQATENAWLLELPESLHEPILAAMNEEAYAGIRGMLFRYDAMIKGLLYIAGCLEMTQPLQLFLHDVIEREDEQAVNIARRYLQSAFEYMVERHGEVVLLHPGLADLSRLASVAHMEGIFSVELTNEMIAGGMHGMLPEERPLHDSICGVLAGSLRPEYSLEEAAEDLRILAKQNVSLGEMEEVMASMLCVMPNEEMKSALKWLHQCTPRWNGVRARLQH